MTFPILRSWQCTGPMALATFVLASCAASPTMTPTVLSSVRTQLAPSGTLRAAINFGNPVLASRDPATGAPRGVSVDLAREFARRLGVEAKLVTYDTAGKVVDAVKAGDWDIAFVAIDPVRGADMDYSAAYVIIEGAYAVRNASPIRSNDEVDRAANRVVVAKGSAYDLYLTRELKQAQLVRAASSQVVVDTMLKDGAEIAAGVKQQLQADLKRVAGVRLLDGRFMVINQAMATPKGRPDGVRYLRSFVEEMKASGFVADALKRHGIEGASVGPPAG